MQKHQRTILAGAILTLALLFFPGRAALAASPAAQTPTPTPADAGAQWDAEGAALYQGGDLAGATQAFERALEAYRQAGDRQGQAGALHSLGIVASKAGQADDALAYLDQALALAQASGNIPLQISISFSRAQACYYSGDYNCALTEYRTTAALARQAGDPQSEKVALTLVGGLESWQGDYAAALEAYTGALSLARQTGDAAAVGSGLYSIGNVRYALGDYAPALEAYQESLDLARQRGDSAGMLLALIGVGDGHEALGETTPALQAYDEALLLARELGDQSSEQTVLADYGWIYYRLEEYPTSEEYYQQALALAQARGERYAQATYLYRIGLARFWGDLPATAEEPYQQALTIWRELGDREMEASSLDILGTIYWDGGRYDEALDVLQASLGIWRELDATENQAMTLRTLANTYSARGEQDAAIAALDEALALAQEAGDSAGVALILTSRSGVYLRQGEYYRAMSLLQQAGQIQHELGDAVGEARTWRSLANVYEDVGQYERALPLLQQALDALQGQRGARRDIAGILNSMGLAEDYLGHAEAALDYYQQALAAAQAVHDRAGEAMALSDLGSYYDSQGQYEPALRYATQALDIYRSLGHRQSEARSLNNIGFTYHNLNEWDKAQSYYEQALAIWQEFDDQANIAIGWGNLGTLYEDRGDDTKALELYEKSMALHEKLRAAAGLDEFKSSMATRYANVYVRAARLYQRRGDAEAAFNVSERARARSFLDQLGGSRLGVGASAGAPLVEREQALRSRLGALQKELNETRSKSDAQRSAGQTQETHRQLTAAREEYANLLTELKLSNPEYAALVSAAPASLADIQALLDPQTTLLAYFLTEDRPLAFVVRRDALLSFELPVTNAELSAALDDFRSFADLSDPTPASLGHLYDWLIRPLRAELKTARLGIIPNLRLHYVPFAAFFDGERYLGEQFALFTLPSASVLPYLRATGEEPAGALLAMAYGQAEGLPLLRYAEREAQAIAGLYGQTALVGAAASESAFRAAAGAAGIIHLAAHGQFDEAQPLFSRVLLAPDAENDGALEVHEVYGLELKRANLVVLSACQTQLGQHSYGDDVIGLNRAFLFAGAPSVVASLWSVDDAATEQLMAAFYGNLRAGLPKAEALQAAQAVVRQSYPHPYYWSAFVLTGDPGQPATSQGRGEGPAALTAGVALAGLALASLVGRRARG